MLCKKIGSRPYAFNRLFVSYLSSNSKIDIKKLEQESAFIDVVDEDSNQKEIEIELSRNKSRLREHDRNLLHNKNPYSEEKIWYHGTLQYKRKLYGRYGEASGVNPSVCWPTEQELEDKREYERVAYPFSIPEMVKSAKEQRELKNEKIRKQQEDMLVKFAKVEGWKKEMEMRIAKKESEANAARLKRERLIEEVRKHFGYKVDPKDDKFKELLEKKEKEQKKLAKEARKKEREAKLLEKLKTKKKNKVDTNQPIKNDEEVEESK